VLLRCDLVFVDPGTVFRQFDPGPYSNKNLAFPYLYLHNNIHQSEKFVLFQEYPIVLKLH
jgi:hypothetical protein